MKHNKELNNCKICQFENGEHSFECSKYKEKDWEKRAEAGEPPVSILNDWIKEFERRFSHSVFCEESKLKCSCDYSKFKQFFAKTLKEEKFALEKEYSWSYGRLLRKELKEQRGEFIEIIKCKNCKGKGEVFVDMASTECSDCGGDGHCIKSKEGWNINQLIKQKYE